MYTGGTRGGLYKTTVPNYAIKHCFHLGFQHSGFIKLKIV